MLLYLTAVPKVPKSVSKARSRYLHRKLSWSRSRYRAGVQSWSRSRRRSDWM